MVISKFFGTIGLSSKMLRGTFVEVLSVHEIHELAFETKFLQMQGKSVMGHHKTRN
jgi:hypothetical protein